MKRSFSNGTSMLLLVTGILFFANYSYLQASSTFDHSSTHSISAISTDIKDIPLEEELVILQQLQQQKLTASCDMEKNLDSRISKFKKRIINHIKNQTGYESTISMMMPSIPCPEIQVVELLGIPGFAETNELVVCGRPDTLAFLIFIEEAGTISGTQMTTTFLPGIQYAGFELTHYGSATISNLDPNPNKPKFLLEGITEGIYIGYIAVEATCDVNTAAFDYMVDLDFSFIYEDTLGNFQQCRQAVTPLRAYNSIIKEPVLNFRSTPNFNLSALGREFCQNIQISQDGIDAYLEEIEFSICDVDFSNELMLTSISANGTAIPYNYDATSSTVNMVISGSDFIGNNVPNPSDTLFDESEILSIRVCMQIDECPSGNTQLISYKASYYCNGDTCQTITSDREIRIRPTDRPIPIATSTLIQEPGICGAPAILEMTLQSSIADSAAGIFTDVTFGFETCEQSSLDISQVTIGGTPIPASTYNWTGEDLNIDLSTLTTDPDGVGGIIDADGDGAVDDLPGGELLTVRVELDFICALPPDPGSISCSSIDSSFSQFYVAAKRDCGQDFTYRPDVDDFSITNGATYIELKNQDIISATLTGYNFGNTRTTGATCSPLAPRVKTVEFCYIYERENISPCATANSSNRLQVLFDGSPILVNDINFVAGSGEMTVNGITTQSGVTGTFTNISTASRLLTLPIGELNVGDEVCYIYQLEADSASCSPAIYMNGIHQVIETCNTGDCTCETIKACDIALFRSDPSNCGCTCDISSGANTRRWNLGYTDECMTEKVDVADVPIEDLNRYLPCDTMYYEGWMTFNSPESVGELYQWYFVANITNLGNNGWNGNDDTELMIDAEGTELLGLDFSPQGGGGTKTPIDIGSLSECLDDPSTGGATGFFAYAGKTPWDDVTLNRPMCSSSWEYHDGNLFGVYFRNFNKLEDCRQREVSSWEEVNCLDQLKATYNIGVGDTIYMRWLLPLTKNVKAAANKIADPSFTFRDPQIINVASGHFLDEFDSDCLVGLSNCRTNSPFTTFCPEDVKALTTLTVDDCGGSVEHTFNVVKPTPVNWFTAEYRPFFTMEDIEIPIYSPLIYCGNAKLVSKCGAEYPLTVQSRTNQSCATVDGQEYCTVSSGTIGGITFNPEADGYPGLGVGLGGYLDDFKIVYDLCKVCPSETPDLSSYEIAYDYRTCETLNGACFRCNQATNNTSNELSNICGLNGATLVDRNQSYYDELGLDTLFRWDDVTSGDIVTMDVSNGFPDLSQNQDQNLLSSGAPGVSEELNTFTICADNDPSLETHRGVLASISLTNSVALIGAYDAAMNSLTFDTVSSSTTSNTYAVFLPDLAPGDCTTFKIGTQLLFCPVAPDKPEICVTTTSGCMDPSIMAALASSTSACNSIETCYEYVFEESGIQADFLLPDGGPYALCDTIPMTVLIKNVKGTTVTDLVLDIDLPLTGAQIIPGSFEASYPNSGNFSLPFYSIVDPLITGNNLLYNEDNDFSNSIHSNGLPGISSMADSNYVLVRFLLETVCDEFVSGSQASFEATATDPCSPNILTSGIVKSNQIIINGGNPADFGQVLITAKPSEAFCGQDTPTFKITGQNISEKPLGDSVIMCVTLPPELAYQTGSMRYIIPSNLSVGTEVVATINGQTQVCFQGYENMPVGGAFTLNFEADFDTNAPCGDYDIMVDTKNIVEDQSCTDGGTCDVFVQSSVNPTFTMTLKGPLETVDLQLFRECTGTDDPVMICYEAVLRNPGPNYTGNVTVNLHDDVLADQVLDFYDPILGTQMHPSISVANGDSIMISGCFTVDELNSCPVILDLVYDSPCECNHLATPYSSLEPAFIAMLPPTTVLCPGQELGLEVCGDYTITYDPASNVITRMAGDSLYLSVVDQSIVTQLNFNGNAGECIVSETRFIRGVEEFDIAIKDSMTCQDQPVVLELTVPIEYQDYVEVQWSPTIFLDDPNRIDPLFTSGTPGIYKYEIALTFNGGCVLKDSVCVEVKPINEITITGDTEICFPYETNTLTADAGFDYYEWYLLDGGFEIINASTTTNTWTGPTMPGKYIVKGFRSTDMCPSVSDTIMIMQAECVDLELEKTICEIGVVPNFGDTISYQIVVCNRLIPNSLLTHDANMVEITDMLPTGVMYVSSTSTQGNYTAGGGGIWSVGTVLSGTCDTLKLNVKLIDYGKQINTAEITNSDKEDIDSEENNDDGDQSEDDEDMAMFTLEPFDLALKKIICPDMMVPVVMVGEVIDYCIIVENQGTVDAYNISIMDHPAPEISVIDPNWTGGPTSWTYQYLDSLLVGQMDTVRFIAQLNAVPPDSSAVNFAEILDAEDIEGDHPVDIDSTPDADCANDGPFEDNLTDNTNGDEDDHDPAAIYVKVTDLALKKVTTVTTPVKIGDDIPYIITVYNQGNVPSTNIKISEYIPDGLDLNAGASTGWMDMDSIAMFLVTDTLAIGDSIEIPITMTILPGATPTNLINVAEISSFQDTLGYDITYNDQDSDGDTDPNNDGVPMPGDPDDNNIFGNAEVGEDEDDSDPEGLQIFDLALIKTTATTGPFTYGDVVTFDFTIYNQGSIPATNIQITEFTPCGYTIAPTAMPLWTVTGNLARTTILDTLQPGDSNVVSIDLIVQPCTAPDAWKNIGEISGSTDDEGNDTTNSDVDSDADEFPTNDGDMEDNATNNENGDEDDNDFEIIEVFDLALIKEIATPGPHQYGDLVEFKITVFNQGNVDANNIIVSDTIPSGYSYSAAANTGWTGTTPIVTYPIPDTLLAGSSTTISIWLEISMASGGNGIYTNIAEISMAQDTSGMAGNDADSDPDMDFQNDEGGEPGGATDNQTDGDGMDDEDDHDPALVEIFDLALKKTTSNTGPFKYGDVLTFNFTVYNQGSVPAQNIEITEFTPCGYSVTPSSIPLWTVNGGVATTTISNIIPAGDSTIISIDLIVQPCGSPDAWKNIGEISMAQDTSGMPGNDIDSFPDDDPDNDGNMEDNATDNSNGDEDDSDFEIIEVFDLAQIKQLATPGPYAYGDTLHYVITVVNQGNIAANNIYVFDYIPLGLIYDPTLNLDWSGAAPTVDILIEDVLLPGLAHQLELYLILGENVAGIDSYTNISEISQSEDDDNNDTSNADADSDPDGDATDDEGGQPKTSSDDQLDGDGMDDEDDHDPAIVEIFDLALKKTIVGNGPFKYGDVLRFDFTVYNQGNVPAQNIEITEFTPCGFRVAPASNAIWSVNSNGLATTTITSTVLPADSIVVPIYLIPQPCNDPNGWKNIGEISLAQDTAGMSVDDIDSAPDNDPTNDGDMDDNTTDNSNEDEDDSDFEIIEIFDLALTKKLAVGQRSYVFPSSVVAYEITVYNQGNRTAYDINITDYIPNNLSFNPSLNTSVATGNSSDWVLSNGTANYVIDSIAVMDSINLLIKLTVNPMISDPFILNIGEISHASDAPGGPNETDADSDPDRIEGNDAGADPANDNRIDGQGIIDEDDHDPAIIYIFSNDDVVIIQDTTTTVNQDTIIDDITGTPPFEEEIETIDCDLLAYCYHGLSIELMSTGMVETWASDLSVNDFSLCSDDFYLSIWHSSLSTKSPSMYGEVNTLPNQLIFTCEDLGRQEVKLYVTDNKGNWNSCTTYIDIQDNNNACNNLAPIDTAMIRISGHAKNWKGFAIEETQMVVANNQYITKADGLYHFDLPANSNYEVIPKNDINPLNGVSTFDLVLMTKHILGIQPFHNPYQWIAADINRSQTITAFDLVQLRRMILAIDKDFQNNTSWRFIDAQFILSNTNPLASDLPETRIIKQLNNNKVIDFVGVKIGDINGNAQANSLYTSAVRKSPDIFDISLLNQSLEAGKHYEITFNTSEIESIQGFQFTLNWQGVSVNKVTGHLMQSAHFGLNTLEQNWLTASWNHPSGQQAKIHIDHSTSLFTLHLVALENISLQEVFSFSYRPTIVEAYDQEGQIMDIELNFEAVESTNIFELYQNKPNPFLQQTLIEYELPESSKIELVLRDEIGRILYLIQQEGKRGHNEILIDELNLPTGFIYYQLNTPFGSKSKKMILVR